MSGLNSAAGWAAQAALTGITLIPLGTFLVLDLRRRVQHQFQQSKMAHMFLRAALPVFMVGVVLAMVQPAVIAAATMRGLRVSRVPAYQAAEYTSMTATFVISAASILTTLAVYLSGIGTLYVALTKPKWWKLLRVDALCGSALLFIIAIAWWARNLVRYQYDGMTLIWLLDIVDIALCLLAAGVVGLAIYVTPKLKERTDLGVGNLPALLFSAAMLWLIRCGFVLAIHIKDTIGDWAPFETQAQKILYPILDLWVSATVLGLLTFIMRRDVWSDPAAIPDMPPQQQPVVFVQQPVYVVQHPQYVHGGYQQYQQAYQQYPQQPVFYVQQPIPLELTPTPTPLPTTRMHEAAGTSQRA